MKNLDFVFESGGIDIHEISFWVKGKNVIVEMKDNTDFEKKSFDDIIIYYGFSDKNNIIINVKGSIGDFITIGSTHVPSGEKIEHLRENSNEILVATLILVNF